MITPVQCRMARAAKGWGVRDLAAKAGVSFSTVTRFENGSAEPHGSTLAVIRQALETAGVEFKPDGAVRLRDGEAAMTEARSS